MDPKIEKQIQDFEDLIAGMEATMKGGYIMRANIHVHIHIVSGHNGFDISVETIHRYYDDQ